MQKFNSGSAIPTQFEIKDLIGICTNFHFEIYILITSSLWYCHSAPKATFNRDMFRVLLLHIKVCIDVNILCFSLHIQLYVIPKFHVPIPSTTNFHQKNIFFSSSFFSAKIYCERKNSVKHKHQLYQ